MNKLLEITMQEFTPKISPEIHGKIEEELKQLPNFIDDIFKNSIKLLSSDIPIEYLGWERMSPKEEIKHMSTNNKYVHDMARSNTYMVKFIFRLHKHEIMEKPMYLIYGEDGNLIKLSGTTYVGSYILSDRSLSPSLGGIFLKLMISKLNFTISYKSIIKNGEKIPVGIINCKILLLNIMDKLGKPITPVFLYSLCRYGISHFDNEMLLYKDDDNNTKTKELMDTHDIYTTIYQGLNSKPRNHMNSSYIPHNIQIAVKKGTGNIHMISAIIYVLDMLPDLEKDLLKVYGNVEKEKELFVIALSRILYKESYSGHRMLEDTKLHLSSLDGYLDIITKNNLKYIDIHVNDFYELLCNIVDKYQDLVVNFKDYHNNLKNKYMDFLPYIGYDIIYIFNKIMLRINRRGKIITVKEIIKNFTELSPKKIYSLIKTNGQNLALSVLENTSDIKYVKATSIQEDYNGPYLLMAG